MVIFSDLSEVLVHGVYGIEELIEKDHGADVSEKFLKRRMEMNTQILDLFRGKITEDEYWKEFIEGADLPENFSEDMAKYYLSENVIRTIDGTYEVYSSISGHPRSLSNSKQVKGRPDIYIVSDHIKTKIPLLHYAHPDIFEHLIKGEYWSCDLGCVKGDLAFFPTLLSKTCIPVEQIVFVDDIKSNIESAEKYGIYSILFKNAKQLKSELIDIGFRFS